MAYRSDRLSELTDADLDELQRRGVRLVCDFRYEREIAVDPSRLPPGAEGRRVPVGADLSDSDRTVEERIRLGELRSITTEEVAVGYLLMLEARAELFGEVVRLVADTERHSVVIHCTAGKDRTGVAAALLLGAVGVSDDDIVADYHLTDRYRTEYLLAKVTPDLESWGVDVADVMPLLATPPETMAHTLAGIEERWGSIRGFLTGPAGLVPSVLDDLAAALVE